MGCDVVDLQGGDRGSAQINCLPPKADSLAPS